MAVQGHRVKRQLVELEVAGRARAERLLASVSRLQREHIAPMLDQVCSELSPPNRIDDVESLVVDLGAVDGNDFEADFIRKLGRELPRALAERIGRREAESVPAAARITRSQLELINAFMRTGMLPWSADATRRKPIESALTELIRTSPRELCESLREPSMRSHAARRLALSSPAAVLAELVALLAPAIGRRVSTIAAGLTELLLKEPRVAGVARVRLRAQVWQGALVLASARSPEELVRGQPKSPERPVEAWLRDTLAAVAAEAGITYASLLGGLSQTAVAPQHDVSAVVRDLVLSLHRELSGGDDRAGKRGSPERVREKTTRAPGNAAEASPERIASGDAVAAEPGTRGAGRHALDAASGAPGDASAPADADADPRERRDTASSRAQANRSRPRPSPATADLRGLDDVEVGNAGLVLLWPFIGRFFERLGLMREGRFVAEAARHRGAALLEFLVTEDPEPPEHVLPLNKVLCGLPLTEVFEPGEPPSEKEIVEATHLLTAAIEHATVLESMSVPDFRSAFLARRGMLAVRDGAWLLRVAREADDVVLDHFPWGFDWVKLAWMESPLRVEW